MKDRSKIESYLREAWTKRREVKYDEARQLLTQAHRLCDEADYQSLGRIFHVYAQFESDHDRHEKALAFCQQSVMNYEKAGNPDRIAHSTRHMADLQRELGQDANAAGNYRAALVLYRENPHTDKVDLANALRGFGLLLEKRNKMEEAITVWQETKELYLACNLQDGVDEANLRLEALAK